MSKRAADRQITQDSVDQDEDLEDAGRFERATQSELETRVFKKARRTQPPTTDPSNDQSEPGRGLFSGIRLTGLQTQQNGLQCLQHTATSTSVAGPVSVGGGSSSLFGPPSSSIARPTFLSELRSLNTSVNDWIGQHVRENPYVDLTPIFRDYEKHLKELDLKFSTATIDKGEVGSEVVASSDSTGEEKKEETGERSDGGREEEGAAESGAVKTPAADKEEREALLSVRAKLFFKRPTDSEFCELGLGQLRVLPGNGEDVRVVMRNDTSLAKVLLNVRVSGALPISCKKNNVFLVCAPNPPLEKKADGEENEGAPVTYLIRVKTATMATQLKKALQCSNADK